jgi:hypothetical protein
MASLFYEALAGLDPEQLLVAMFVLVDGESEQDVALYLSAMLDRPYTRDRVHQIRRTATRRIRAGLDEKETVT